MSAFGICKNILSASCFQYLCVLKIHVYSFAYHKTPQNEKQKRIGQKRGVHDRRIPCGSLATEAKRKI